MRKVILVEDEHYHVFNRGVEKRDIFLDQRDILRFLESIKEFNTEAPIGSIFEQRLQKNKFGSRTPKSQLVDVVCYCLNPNHFHLVLKQNSARGIQKFMQKLGTGYANYFNEKYKRSGSLFQGKYKAVHIASNEQLLHVSVYVNLNNQFGSRTPKLSTSSWNEYVVDKKGGFCSKEIILGQFKSPDSYRIFAESTLPVILEKKKDEQSLELWESDSQMQHSR